MRGRLMRLLLLGVMTLLLEACATVSGGHIPPSAFEFHDFVSEPGPEPGGWKIAQVEMLRLLVKSLNGATVTKFVRQGIEPTTFPED